MMSLLRIMGTDIGLYYTQEKQNGKSTSQIVGELSVMLRCAYTTAEDAIATTLDYYKDGNIEKYGDNEAITKLEDISWFLYKEREGLLQKK